MYVLQYGHVTEVCLNSTCSVLTYIYSTVTIVLNAEYKIWYDPNLKIKLICSENSRTGCVIIGLHEIKRRTASRM